MIIIGLIMKKSIVIAFLKVTLISGLLLFDNIPVSLVRAATNVNGIINSDTTWTKANSPYSLTGPLLVNETTLTIEAGVTVNINGHYIQVNGTLWARGNAINPIHIDGGKIVFSQSSNDWNEQTGTGSIIERAVLAQTEIIILNSSPKITSNTINGNLDVQEGSPIISNNIITGGISVGGESSLVIWNNTIMGSDEGVGLHANGNNAIVSGNAVSGCQTGIAVYTYGTVSDNIISGCQIGIAAFQYGNPKIERNLIRSNTQGITIVRDQLYVYDCLYIENNTITDNSIGISINPFMKYVVSARINNNNIYANENSNLESSVSNEIDATYNWWGTTDTQAINDTIHDVSLDFMGGTVKFIPFLTEPNPNATPDPNASAQATPTPTPHIPPKMSPSSPANSPTPSQEPRQPDLTVIVGAAIVAVVFGAGLGLLIYLAKRK